MFLLLPKNRVGVTIYEGFSAFFDGLSGFSLLVWSDEYGLRIDVGFLKTIFSANFLFDKKTMNELTIFYSFLHPQLSLQLFLFLLLSLSLLCLLQSLSPSCLLVFFDRVTN